MKTYFWAATAMALALAGCNSSEEPAASGEPAILQLTPGAWAANDDQASYADEEGNLLATFLCDAETQELILEMPGGFAEGARPAMMLRAGDFMHGVDPVEVRNDPDGPVRLAHIPVGGPLSTTIIELPVPLTIEADGAEAIMVETDAVLQGFFQSCAASAGTASDTADTAQ